jgi:glycine dehydrogenase subunit 1
MVAIYLATLGPRGLREACEQNIRKTDYAVNAIQTRTRHKVLFPAPRFNEFVVQLEGGRPDVVQQLIRKNIVPGFHLGETFPELGDALLVCVTETASRDQIDALVEGLG